MTKNAELLSMRYQDYVICNGRLVGKFEDMYRNASEVPWHQDETVDAVFSDLTVALLRRRHPKSLLDVGCGLGYMVARLKREISGLVRVVGLDVSATAVAKAGSMFPDIEFRAGQIVGDAGAERFDMVVSKDVLWYVLADLSGYLSSLVNHSQRWVYIGQSFPEQKPFLGDAILPNATALRLYVENLGYRVVYSLVERDAEFQNREYIHLIIEKD
jgi:SAM-dependent methyltransferase